MSATATGCGGAFRFAERRIVRMAMPTAAPIGAPMERIASMATGKICGRRRNNPATILSRPSGTWTIGPCSPRS